MIANTLNEQHSKIEWLMIGALTGLMVVGVFFIYSATMANEALSTAPWYSQRYLMQIAWYVFGVSAAAAICVVDYHVLARWSLVVYWLSLIHISEPTRLL